ncbi:EamA family transporter [Achromobacter xylosoxidans]
MPLAAPALLRHRQALWRGLPTLLPLAVLGMGVAVAPQYIGAQSTSATNIALIFSCSPILVALLEAIIWRKPSRRCAPPGWRWRWAACWWC